MLEDGRQSIKFPLKYFENNQLIKKKEFLDSIEMIIGILQMELQDSEDFFENQIENLKKIFSFIVNITSENLFLNKDFEKLQFFMFEIFSEWIQYLEQKENLTVTDIFPVFESLSVIYKSSQNESIDKKVKTNVISYINEIFNLLSTQDFFELNKSDLISIFYFYMNNLE